MLGLTERRRSGARSLHASTIVSDVVVGAGANGPAGAQKTQPLTLFLVAWVRHWCRNKLYSKQETSVSVKAQIMA